MIELRGRPIAITGASSGIGRATAVSCARAGMPVALMARREDKLGAVADEINGAGGRAVVFAGSVDDQEACEAFVRVSEDRLGPLFAMFANAGYGYEKPTNDNSLDEIRRIFEVNFYGSLHAIRAASTGMLDRHEGHLIMCSSCIGKLGIPHYAAYCATKAAQDHFGRAMRHEMAPKGVCVSTVHPIGTRTEFFETAAGQSGGRLKLQDPEKQRAFMQPASKVAEAVVRRLARNKGGEIWTAPMARTMFGMAVAFPGITDFLLERAMKKRAVEG